MPKVSRPRIKGPDIDDDFDDMQPAAAAGPRVHARNIKYSVAWFRDRIATYALGTVICGAAMLTLAMWMGGSLGAFGKNFQNGVDVIFRSAGLSITRINVVGLDPLVEERTREMAGVNVGGNMLTADPYAIKKRVEQLEAVSDVQVHRFWPNQITIMANPRDPIALWQDESGAYRVIDQKGRTLAEADPQKYMHLPRIAGEDAASAAATLVTAMAGFPDLAVRMESATRIGGRRWDVKFRSGGEVSLPEDPRLVDALNALNMMQARNRVLDLPVTRIDARQPERMALTPMAGTPKNGGT
ncbi:MAG TPA: cell division protein FtsQ/DivIB [Hyphomonadaceae bacterium]|jgi:cell division protein FtsQ|nr:cell division protein FtsQ/DivIB [Hyphomonadaceae bacterium]